MRKKLIILFWVWAGVFTSCPAQNLIPNGNLEQQCGKAQGRNSVKQSYLETLPDCCNANYLNYWIYYPSNPYKCGSGLDAYEGSGFHLPLYIDTSIHIDFTSSGLQLNNQRLKNLHPVNGKSFYYLPVRVGNGFNCHDTNNLYHYIGFNLPLLKKGIKYEFSMFYNGNYPQEENAINVPNRFFFTNGLGFGLYNTPPNVLGNYADPIPKQRFKLPSVGVDTVWKQAKWTFTADSNYKLLVIGNFFNWYELQYLPYNSKTVLSEKIRSWYSYGLDSLVLQPKGNLAPAIVGNDTVCANVNFKFANITNEACAWEINGNIIEIDTTFTYSTASSFKLKAWNSAGSWEKQIVVMPYTKPVVTQDKIWCKNTIRLTPDVNTYTYQWKPEGVTQNYLDVSDTIDRTLLIDAKYCKDTQTVKIEYGCPPKLDYMPDTPCIGTYVTFWNTEDKRPLKYYVNGVYYGTVTQMIYRAAENMTVKIENPYGSDEKTLINLKNCGDVKIYVPTGLVYNSQLTPALKPVIVNGTLQGTLEIYNRWGSKIYVGDVNSSGWNPNTLNDYKQGEVFVWHIKGRSESYAGKSDVVNIRGTVTVIK